MKISVKDIKGKETGELEVRFPLVEGGKGTQAVHDVVVAYRAAQRRAQLAPRPWAKCPARNKKPWRQKGTGRARAGSRLSPRLWAGGGVVFGPRPRDFSKKVSKTTRQLALRKALTERLKAGDVVVVDDIKLGVAKDQRISSASSNALEIEGTALLVIDGADEQSTAALRATLSNVEAHHQRLR